jgi:hypothetical protein
VVVGVVVGAPRIAGRVRRMGIRARDRAWGVRCLWRRMRMRSWRGRGMDGWGWGWGIVSSAIAIPFLGSLAGGGGGGVYGSAFGDAGQHSRLRTQTGSTAETFSSSTSSGIAPSTAYTTPDIGLGNLGSMPPGLSGGIPSSSSPSNGNTGAVTPTTPTPLTPVVALATSDAEAQVGLAKVAEPDLDAFMTYAAIVPEYSRLETMVMKGIV